MKKRTDKTVITEVEKKIDRIREEIEKEVKVKKMGWFDFWQEKRKLFLQKGYIKTN